ncbi:MAG: FAD-dependent oxidoreductase, partial [Betaproteobacteria bacterium]
VGGGHAQLSVLEALARARPTNVEIVLVTQSRYQIYSGMLPGWVAGHYDQAQCRIDLEPLARSARVRLLTDRVVGLVADQRRVTLRGGPPLEYDLLSLDVGSETDLSSLHAAHDKVLPVKPLDGFFEVWPAVMSAAHGKPGYRLVVIGGGAAGVELALAASYAFGQAETDACVDLVACELLPGYAPGVRSRVEHALARAHVQVHGVGATGTQEGVLLADGTALPADLVLAATGARASQWLEPSGLMLDAHNYVAVDEFHRSRSHPDVFAAGDVSARTDVVMARSGVHAVHAGPVLGANLLATLQGGPLRTYSPRRRSLYLLACGPRYAIASWGRLSAEGRWVWRWKDRIDRGFVARFANPDR